jgi:hypothetical protein
MGCFAYCAQCAFDRLRAMRFGDFGIECAYGAIYAKSIVGPGAGCAGKILAMLCRHPACCLRLVLLSSYVDFISKRGIHNILGMQTLL